MTTNFLIFPSSKFSQIASKPRSKSLLYLANFNDFFEESFLCFSGGVCKNQKEAREVLF
jgi:hypothetical protein